MKHCVNVRERVLNFNFNSQKAHTCTLYYIINTLQYIKMNLSILFYISRTDCSVHVLIVLTAFLNLMSVIEYTDLNYSF